MTSVSGSGERILAILDKFTETRSDWTSEALMAELGYSRPTLYRYLKTLKDAGFLVSLPNAGYTLGPRVTELDFLMRRSDPLVRLSANALRRLVATYPCAALLMRWYGQKILCIASEKSAADSPSSYSRGRPMPLARGAISRAILAFLPRREQIPIIEDLIGEFAQIGIGGTVSEVLDTMRNIRRAGYAVAHGEVTSGVIGIAAPILAGERAPVAAICMTVKARDADSPEVVDAMCHEILQLSLSISRELIREMSGNMTMETQYRAVSGR